MTVGVVGERIRVSREGRNHVHEGQKRMFGRWIERSRDDRREGRRASGADVHERAEVGFFIARVDRVRGGTAADGRVLERARGEDHALRGAS